MFWYYLIFYIYAVSLLSINVVIIVSIRYFLIKNYLILKGLSRTYLVFYCFIVY